MGRITKSRQAMLLRIKAMNKTRLMKRRVTAGQDPNLTPASLMSQNVITTCERSELDGDIANIAMDAKNKNTSEPVGSHSHDACNMSELDKFKRRTIRSVARMLIHEKKSPEELWAEMKKETGTDCRVVWERMQALCIKKLNRMIVVEDRATNLPSIARLTLTDWLLVDLVIVHQDIDLIAMESGENQPEVMKELPALIELFNLVQRYEIEGRSGDDLATAWAAATVHYNMQGRQCSPMLLQRRWHQMKKLTRSRFYKFWFAYRGNVRLLEEARKNMPTRLQMAIAKRYPQVITKEFPEWEDLLAKDLIILPQEFEAKMRMPNLPKPCDSKAPDLVLVEPVIETIDVESDGEDNNDDEVEDNSDPEKSNDATDITHPPTEGAIEDSVANDEAPGILVEQKPLEEDGLSNVQLVSATHVPQVEIPDEGPDESPITTTAYTDISKIKKESQMDTNSDVENDIIEIPSDPAVEDDLESNTENITKKTRVVSGNDVPCDVENINDSDDGLDDIIKVKADAFCSKTNEIAMQSNVIDDLIKDKVEEYLKMPVDDITLSTKKPDTIVNLEKAEASAIDLMADLNFVDDGIEFVDDGVEFVEEDNSKDVESTGNMTEEESEENSKFDLKLLMVPVVYTTKLDHMKIFNNKQFHTVENKEDLEMAAFESKPVSDKAFKMKMIEEKAPSIADDTANSDDIFINREVMNDGDSEEDDTVSPNSYMLKKPKTRTYDPIKLCKNPDFNTKLRRLTIGFFGVPRNRQLLNACIPMTIDLSKAFESKLVNETLYLKSSGAPPAVVKEKVIEKQASSIVPTAMPAQSLIDNSITSIQNLISNPAPAVIPTICERTKIINLPDIDKVRKINQQLLTAQVPPLRVYAGNSRRERTPIPQEVTPATPIIEPVKPDIEPPLLPDIKYKIKVEGEKSTDTLPSETVIPAKQKLLKIINQAKISTQEALAKIDDEQQTDNPMPMPIALSEAKSNVVQEPPTRKYNYSAKPTMAWATRVPPQKTPRVDDFGLLAADTLNKMLHLLMSGDQDGKGCKCCNNKPKKKKNKKKERTNSTSKDDRNDSSTKDCCWAYQKLHRKRTSVHSCLPNPCTCCSAEKLVSKIQADRDKKRNTKKSTKVKSNAAIVLSDDDDDDGVLKKACESIEAVVQQSANEDATAAVSVEEDSALSLTTSPTPSITVTPSVSIDDGGLKKVCESIEAVIQQSGNEHATTGPLPSVTVTPSVSIDVKTPSATSPAKVKVTVDFPMQPVKPPKPYMLIRAASTASLMQKKSNLLRPPTPRINVVPQLRPVAHAARPPAPAARLYAPPAAPANPAVTTPCSCARPALSQGSRRNIVIDASRHCALHPTPIAPKPSPEKEGNSKVVYLHSKNLAKSPSESPIFLGKNKILLTTVKFPVKNDDSFQVSEPIFQQPKVIPALPIPPGVQLVLMPSGNVMYTVDPGVELTVEQMSSLPSILAAVQEQLNASGVASSSNPVGEVHISETESIQPVTDAIQLESNTPIGTDLPITEPQHTESNITNDTIETPPVITLETDEVFQDTELSSKTDTDGVQVDTDPTFANTSTPQETSELPPMSTNGEDMQVDTDLTVANASTPQEPTKPPPKTTNGDNMQVDTDLTVANASTPQETTKPPPKTTNNEDMQVATDTPNVYVSTPQEANELQPKTTNSKDMQIDTDPTIATASPSKETTDVPSKTINGEDMEVDTDPTITGVSVAEETLNSHSENESIPKDTLTKETTDPEANIDQASTQAALVAVNLQNETQTQDVQPLAEGEKTNDNDGINNRKTLLSDLMEMSGISAEDTTAPEPVAEPPIIDLQDTSIVIANEGMNNVPELSPVTSFAELKYACEQNGKFFKLDFETGVIVPINVCIKKNPKNQVTPVPIRRLKNKEFIDLTDDLESPDDESPEKQDTVAEELAPQEPMTTSYTYQGKTLNVSNAVKPVKLFKAFRPTPPPRLLKRSSLLKSNQPLKLANFVKKTHLENRKQLLIKGKIEAKIDLVDSDEPMEEEYLVNSSDEDEQPILEESMLVEALDIDLNSESDDSSDDEPLAKKSKRMKMDQSKTEEAVRETNIYDEIPNASDPTELTFSDIQKLEKRTDTSTPLLHNSEIVIPQLPENKETPDPVPKVSERKVVESPQKVRIINPELADKNPPATSVVENNLNEPEEDEFTEDDELENLQPQLRFMSDNSEEEDCILGV